MSTDKNLATNSNCTSSTSKSFTPSLPAVSCYTFLFSVLILFFGVIMADTTRFTVICPCCETTLSIDSQTGALIAHEEKSRPLASFDEMVKGLDKQKQVREQIFSQE